MKKGIIRALLFITLIILAVVLGKAVAGVASGVPFLSWLAITAKFGISTVTVDLSILTLTFGMLIDVSVAQALLLLAAIFTYVRIQGKG
jgi:hypothetical protein